MKIITEHDGEVEVPEIVNKTMKDEDFQVLGLSLPGEEIGKKLFTVIQYYRQGMVKVYQNGMGRPEIFIYFPEGSKNALVQLRIRKLYKPIK